LARQFLRCAFGNGSATLWGGNLATERATGGWETVAGPRHENWGFDFQVAVDLGVEAGAVEDDVAGGFEGHLFDGEGVAQDVLGEVFEVGLMLGPDPLAGVEVEAAVFPGVKELGRARGAGPGGG